MYVSGSIVDFESRLHQFATYSQDFADFVFEGNSYFADLVAHKLEYFIEKWNRELIKKGQTTLIDGSGSVQNSIGGIGGGTIIGVGGDTITGI